MKKERRINEKRHSYSQSHGGNVPANHAMGTLGNPLHAIRALKSSALGVGMRGLSFLALLGVPVAHASQEDLQRSCERTVAYNLANMGLEGPPADIDVVASRHDRIPNGDRYVAWVEDTSIRPVMQMRINCIRWDTEPDQLEICLKIGWDWFCEKYGPPPMKIKPAPKPAATPKQTPNPAPKAQKEEKPNDIQAIDFFWFLPDG